MIDFSAALAAYALAAPVHITPLSESGLNNQMWAVQAGSNSYILKQHTSTSYKDRASTIYEHHMLRHLAQQHLSFALPVPLLTRTGETLCQTASGDFSLAHCLPGKRFQGSEHLTAFGSALGELHVALATLPIKSRPGRPLFERLFDFPDPAHNVMTLTAQTLGVEETPALHDLLSWWQEEAQALAALAAGPYRSLPWQICHNDFTPNNVLVLVDQGRVSAVLDFEFASPAARALDVVMALRMTMRSWENPTPWPIVEAFFAGYKRWVHLSQSEIEALPWLLRLRSAMSILWWVGRQQNLARVPSLIENQHTLVNWLNQYEEQFLESVSMIC